MRLLPCNLCCHEHVALTRQGFARTSTHRALKCPFTCSNIVLVSCCSHEPFFRSPTMLSAFRSTRTLASHPWLSRAPTHSFRSARFVQFDFIYLLSCSTAFSRAPSHLRQPSSFASTPLFWVSWAGPPDFFCDCRHKSHALTSSHFLVLFVCFNLSSLSSHLVSRRSNQLLSGVSPCLICSREHKHTQL